MSRYGRTLAEKDGFSLVEKIDTASDGSTIVVGYVIVGPDGTELESFAANEFDEAMEALERIAEGDKPSSGPRM